MSAVARWLGGKAVLYLLLVVAIGFFTLAWPTLKSTDPASSFGTDMMSPDEIKAELDAARIQTQERLQNDVERLRAASDAEQARRLSAAKVALTAAMRQRQEYGGVLDNIRPSKILEQRRLELRTSKLQLEIAALEAMRSEGQARRSYGAARAQALRLAQVPTPEAIQRAQATCRRATAAVAAFNERWPPDRLFRDVIRDERAKLTQAQRRTCTGANALAKQRQAGLRARQVAQRARLHYNQARNWAVGTVDPVSAGIPRAILSEILKSAALLLALIVALPLIIRLLFYFVLAPIAERRPAIRLPLAQTAAGSIPLPHRSQTSLSIELREGEELVVRQGFLQASSETGTKHTRWLLDWRHPLSSIASGMTFLTRIAGKHARATVSAVHDPLAEVTLIELPNGSSCVVLPRALAAVVQPIARPLRITRHWRLNSLHSWLTLQLRYLVFHGPARLIIKGSRGVRVEPAQRGRIFGQRQLVGFSTDLAYSVKRTETFWPYFLGREQLLKDRVEDGDGLLIVEEAPLAGRQAGQAKRGLEGAFDAGLKAFGL